MKNSQENSFPDCDHVRPLAWDFLNGLLPASEHKRTEIHLKSCARCREVYEDASTVLEELNRQKELSANPFLSTRLAAQIQQTAQSRAATGFGYRMAQLAISLVMVGVGLFTGSYLSERFHNQTDVLLTTSMTVVNNDEELYLFTDCFVPAYDHLTQIP